MPTMPSAGRATKVFRRASATLFAMLMIVGVTACEVAPSTGDAGVRQVTVVGSGTVQGAPDTFTVDFGIEFTAPDVTTAMNQTSERAGTVIQALVDDGVERKNISTTNVDVQPVYATAPVTDGTQDTSTSTTQQQEDGTTATAVPSTTTPVAYRATNSLSVKIDDPDSASQVLARIISSGGDATRLNSVGYSIADDSQLVKDARARAFNDAKDRAQQYAELSGLTLGSVISISEASSSSPSPENRAMAAAPVPVEPGQQSVSFSVTVIFELN